MAPSELVEGLSWEVHIAKAFQPEQACHHWLELEYGFYVAEDGADTTDFQTGDVDVCWTDPAACEL